MAKISKDVNEPVEAYFQDVEMQALAAHLAREFNKLNLPKKVEYLEASVIECHDRASPVPGILGDNVACQSNAVSQISMMSRIHPMFHFADLLGGRVVFAVERYIHGTFCKYTNNYGWINPGVLLLFCVRLPFEHRACHISG